MKNGKIMKNQKKIKNTKIQIKLENKLYKKKKKSFLI